MVMRVFWFMRLTLAVDDIYKNVNDNDGACPTDACTAEGERANLNAFQRAKSNFQV